MGRKAEPPLDLAVPIGTVALSGLFGISVNKLIALTHAGVLRLYRDTAGMLVSGKYLLNQSIVDYTRHLRGLNEASPRSHFEEARARRALAAAAVNELRVERLNAHLIDVDPALECVDALVLRFRAKLLAFVPRMAREAYGAVSAEDAHEKVENLAGEILAELRKIGPQDLQKPGLRVLGSTESSTDEEPS
jgi:hypothetical protein